MASAQLTATAVVPTASSSTQLTTSRPRLLPHNRRLRHLKRITLHNLAFARPPSRPPLRAADDHSIVGSSLRSPKRSDSSTRLAVPPSASASSAGGLSYARSFEDLPSLAAAVAAVAENVQDVLPHDLASQPQAQAQAQAQSKGKGKGKAAVPQGAPGKPAALRRWSLALTGQAAGPRERQAALERAVESRLADVFFSLHVEGQDEPVYVSEIIERSMNCNFGVFDLSQHPPAVSRSSRAIVKVWACRPRQEWVFLIRDTIDLRAASFLGTDPSPSIALPSNTLILHLSDGIYSLDMPAARVASLAAPSAKDSQPRNQVDPAPMASYNTLMKLSTLESSLRDVVASQGEVAAHVDRILADPVAKEKDELPLAQDDLERAASYVAQQERALGAAQKRRDGLRESLCLRREAIEAGERAAEQAAAHVADAREKLEASKEAAARTRQQIQGQRRRICNDLATTYPITTDPGNPAPLSFRICGLALPNTTYDSATARMIDEDAISAALGFAAGLTDQLQYYLNVPVPYPISSHGSRSMIRDDISLVPDASSTALGRQSAAGAQQASVAPRQRDYPLHLPRGGSTAGQFRFEYAWYLLNKNIEALCAAQGLRVVDIRHTLPNLKYLLYVCGAGSDAEVPERKKGGIRGLLAGRMVRSSNNNNIKLAVPDTDGVGSLESSGGSRPGSADSEATQLHRALVFGERRGGGLEIDPLAAGPASPASAAGPLQGFKLSFDDGPGKMTLRTKGLRENVASS